MKMNRAILLVLAGVISLSGCGSDSDDDGPRVPPQVDDGGDGNNDGGDGNNDGGDGTGGDDPSMQPLPDGPATALYAPSTNDLERIPFPADALLAGTPDGSINISGVANTDSEFSPDAAALSDPLVALNTMDGFGVTTDMLIRFTGQIDPETLRDGIRIYADDFSKNYWPVLGSTRPPIEVDYELIWGLDYVAEAEPNGIVRITIVKPLKPHTTYVVTATQALQTRSGDEVSADAEYELLQSQEPFVFRTGTEEACDYTNPPASLADCTDLNATYEGELTVEQALELEGHRQATNARLESVVAWTPTDPELTDYTDYQQAADDIVLSYGVSTQHAGYALERALDEVDGTPTPEIDVTDSGVAGAQARFYSGTLNGAVQFIDPADAHGDLWEDQMNRNLVIFNGMFPMMKSPAHSIPVLVSVPSDPAACGTHPVVMFQHDLGGSRADLRAVADTLAGVCAVGVAIDLPKHGIAPNDAEHGQLSRGAEERLVDIPDGAGDYCVQGDAIDIGNGEMRCPSGDGYVNVGNLANARDTVRQSLVDMYSLYRALTGGALTAGELGLSSALDTSGIHFLGHSFGSALGVPFVANAVPDDGSERFGTLVFNAGPAGGLFKMLDGSPELEEELREVIDANKPSVQWEMMVILAQTMVDSVDGFNFTRDLALSGPVGTYDQAPILAQEIVGTYTDECPEGRCPDQVIPNNLYGDAYSDEWSLVAHVPQDGWLAGQNPATVPTILAGTDAMVEGTLFMPAAIHLPPQEASTVGPLGPIELDAYTGLGLTEMTGSVCAELASQNPAANGMASASGQDLVRFTAGSNDSLLGTDGNTAARDLMHHQIAQWIATGGTQIPCDPAYGTAGNLMRH